jgi:hypothetical protein
MKLFFLVASAAAAPLMTTLLPEVANPVVMTTLLPEFANPRTMTTLLPEFAYPRTMTTLMPEFAQPNAGGVYFDRTVNTIQHITGAVTFDKGCTASDPYGSNKCTWDWKTGATVTVAGALQEDITSGKLVVDLKINNVIPFSFSCPICGANCTFEIPIIKKPETFAMPPCPIKAVTIPSKSIPFTLPDKNPLGISASVSGTVQIADQSGGVIFKLSLNAKVS